MIIEFDDRKYQISKVDVIRSKLALADITFANSTGFPIFRKEYLSRFERELELSDFFDKPKQEELSIQTRETQQFEKRNFHISDDNLGVGGAMERYQRNIEAIKLLKRIESEIKLATVEEQGHYLNMSVGAVLQRYLMKRGV